jgi:hypothetical protein
MCNPSEYLVEILSRKQTKDGTVTFIKVVFVVRIKHNKTPQSLWIVQGVLINFALIVLFI